MFVWTFLLRITHTIISQSSADSSWITLYMYILSTLHNNEEEKQHQRIYLSTLYNINYGLYCKMSSWILLMFAIFSQNQRQQFPPNNLQSYPSTQRQPKISVCLFVSLTANFNRTCQIVKCLYVSDSSRSSQIWCGCCSMTCTRDGFYPAIN